MSKPKQRFKFEAWHATSLPDVSKRQLSQYFFAFVDFANLAGLSLDSDSETMEPSEPENTKRFFPSGAIFFFALLIAFYAALWLVVYWLMIARA
jgi:hypothetical protein